METSRELCAFQMERKCKWWDSGGGDGKEGKAYLQFSSHSINVKSSEDINFSTGQICLHEIDETT